MCDTCGCGEPEEYSIRKPDKNKKKKHSNHEHDHQHDPEGDHDDGHHHHHDHGHDHDHEYDLSGKRVIEIRKDILSENNLVAERNRGYFEGREILCLNMVSSPGSGKTSILERTIHEFGQKKNIFVIEGDQQSSHDAERILQAGAPAIQINTGKGCHLDASMVGKAMKQLGVEKHSIVFIENVGNLVCPSLFDLGENRRVIIMSVTEGDDKPVKYPDIYASSQLCLINKTDLLPYVDFKMKKAMEYARMTNPSIEFIPLSAKSGEGFNAWYAWLEKNAL